jgi:hypothetical protein
MAARFEGDVPLYNEYMSRGGKPILHQPIWDFELIPKVSLNITRNKVSYTSVHSSDSKVMLKHICNIPVDDFQDTEFRDFLNMLQELIGHLKKF